MPQPYLIAEAGSNFQRDLDTAKEMQRVAKEAGTDCVKFQLFAPDFYDGAGDHALPTEWVPALIENSWELGIDFLCTPFSTEAVDYLDKCGVDAFKIASPELVDDELLRHVAKKRKKIYLSTGMSTLADVDHAIRVLDETDRGIEIVLLHCVSTYPAKPAQMNLRAMSTMRQAFGYHVGLSDHTEGIAVPIAAATIGASVIEKHFTLDRSQTGPDHSYALEPDELYEMVRGIRDAKAALGSGRKTPANDECWAARGRTIK